MEPRGEEHKFVSSTGLSAEELLAATGETPAQPARRVEIETETEKKSDPKYIAEFRLMKQSRDYYARHNVLPEHDPRVGPEEDTIESNLRAAYEEGKDLDPQQIRFAQLLIDSREESRIEARLKDRDKPLQPAEEKQYKILKAEYREKLRDFVGASEGELTQDDLAAWIGEFSGDRDWAEKQLVPEEAAKIALYNYLDGRRDLHVRYASSKESAADGHDMVATPYNEVLGGAMKVKAKPVAAQEGDVFMRQGVVEMEIPKSKVRDFEFTDANDAEELASLMSKAARGTNVAYSSERRHD